MPKLSAIVGSILRELAQSHTLADAQTRQVFENYRNDPVLSQFPIPRVVIQQATLKLRFIVTQYGTGPVADDPKQYKDLWRQALRERVVPGLLSDIGKRDNTALLDAVQKRLSKTNIEDQIELEQLLNPAKLAQLQQETVKLLVAEVESLPKSVRRLLPESQQLQAAVTRVVDHEMPAVQRAAIALQKANQAAQNNLDVEVRAEELKSVPDSQINELELTVAIEDIARGEKE